MTFVDILILFVLILFAILGFNRGVIKSLIVLLGFIIVIIASYSLKNYIGDIMVLNLPFVVFGHFLEGAQALNVIMYQAIAFVILLALFGAIYKLLVTISGILEKILRFTIILGIPSKIFGAIFGFIEGYVIVYLVLFVLTQPFIKMDFLNESKYVPKIVNNSPIISSFAEKSLNVFNKIKEITSEQDSEEMNRKIVKLILDENVTSKEVMQKLVEKQKLTGDDIKELIENYQEKR